MVAGHLADAILLQQRGVLLGDLDRVERRVRATNDVDDKMLALLVTDGERVGVTTAAGGIDESLVIGRGAEERRQLERTAVLDSPIRSIDRPRRR